VSESQTVFKAKVLTKCQRKKLLVYCQVIPRYIKSPHVWWLEVIVRNYEVIRRGTLFGRWQEIRVSWNSMGILQPLTDHSCPSKTRYPHLYSLPSEAMNFLNRDLNIGSQIR
jgi:hypothetical protein